MMRSPAAARAIASTNPGRLETLYVRVASAGVAAATPNKTSKDDFKSAISIRRFKPCMSNIAAISGMRCMNPVEA